jgi:aryl-alcohol dehydrogenase-like predicted oxidoreductase
MSMSFRLGPAMDKNEAIKLIRPAFDQGVTFFDTAEAYGPFANDWPGSGLKTIDNF